MALLNRIFGRSESSGKVASERLRKVVVQDRANVSPQTMDQMRTQVLNKLAEYMEVDEKNSSITISANEGSVNLVANIPIRRMKRGKH
ncbi:MAG: cell division topological specificity factor MinE [Armatimonadetes bacterium]|jgi:cell division topological specificity factor|nr:cell division topological specificity factor MinE [Armatimonadota bacterium]